MVVARNGLIVEKGSVVAGLELIIVAVVNNVIEGVSPGRRHRAEGPQLQSVLCVYAHALSILLILSLHSASDHRDGVQKHELHFKN